METVFEFLFELYLSMMMLVVPEEKTSKYRWVVILLGVISMFGILALFFWGYILITEHGNLFGWLPIIIAALLSLAQIIAGFYAQSKKDK